MKTEPNKLETHFKEKLNSREIQPSEMAWNRLDAMLSVTEEKKVKRSFGWLSLAASILLLVTIGTFFFHQKNIEVTPVNSVVLQTKDSSKSTKTKFKIPKTDENKQSKLVLSVKNTILKKQQVAKNKLLIINQKTIISPKNQTEEAFVNQKLSSYKEKIAIKNELNSTADELLVANLDNVVNESSNSTVKVNAKSLLSQVDDELEQSFRETKLEKIQRNFKTVKEALANRNNQ